MTDPITTLRQQLQQLKQQHDAGTLSARQYEARKAPLERRLVEAVMTTAAATPSVAAGAAPAARTGVRLWAGSGALVLLVAAAGYWWTGSLAGFGRAPADVTANAGAAAGSAAGAAGEFSHEQLQSLVAKLAARMQEQPDDPKGWVMLGRSYSALGQPAEALSAYERALKLRPDDAATIADYADALAVQNGRSLEGEPLKFIERALALDPDNLKALMLAGTAAFDREDYAAAVAHWERVVKIGPADSSLVEMARGGVAEARERGKIAPTAGATGSANAKPSTAAAPSATAAAAGAISGMVSLAPALRGKVAADDTVFVFARPATGSRMPLAILRMQVKDLPASFTLDDSLSMSPAARLSAAGQVVVGARISKSGQAMPQPGDLESVSAPLAVGSAGVAVVIDSAVK